MSCSTNPAQKFTQRPDKSLAHESSRQHVGLAARSGPSYNQEFAAFRNPQLDPQAMNDIYADMAVAHEAAQLKQRAPMPQASPSAASAGWAHQFSQMSLDQAQPGPAPRLQHAQPAQHGQGQVQPAHARSFAHTPSLAHTSWQTPQTWQHPTRTAPAPAANEADLSKAFAAAESRMNALSSQLNEPSRADNDNVQEVARGVLATVESTTTTEAVAEKMRNSTFIDLMKKMSNKQVLIRDNALVENSEGATEHEWKGPTTEDPEIKLPVFEQRERERARERAAQVGEQQQGSQHAHQPHAHPPTKRTREQIPLQDPRGGQQPKEDVHEYLQRIGTPEHSERLQMPSALHAAQELGPIPVSVAQWEEDYSAWAGEV